MVMKAGILFIKRYLHQERLALLDWSQSVEKLHTTAEDILFAITVIGGLLSQAERMQVFWEQIAEDVSSIVADDDGQIFSILSLSYNYLPYHLKPCLLYSSAFPEDSEIHASRLIKLWVAEGFLKPISGKSLEEAAEMYLMDLVGRNLVFIRQQRPEGNVKSYGIHDLVRDLCVKKAYEEKFILFINLGHIQGDVHSRHIFAGSTRYIDRLSRQISLARSFVFTGAGSKERELFLLGYLQSNC
ncbi:UNVERIFIED_CONTAM: putative late blight resistance proteinR1B-17 [Sesamum latifolium]|uniref:Late blight resistance proteinR1B-17 n=1 Tax=Sesamum latifolium TaxID=2727402 RepID=A0AAW2UWW2_9LAMI